MKTTKSLMFIISVVLLSSCSTYHYSNFPNSSDLLQVQSASGQALMIADDQPLPVQSVSAIDSRSAAPEVKNITNISRLESINSDLYEAIKAVEPQSGKRKIVKKYIREHKSEIKNELILASASGELPSLNKSQKAGGAPFIERPWAALLGFLIPPLGVGLYFGKDKRTWIALALSLLFWLPASIYALVVILRD